MSTTTATRPGDPVANAQARYDKLRADRIRYRRPGPRGFTATFRQRRANAVVAARPPLVPESLTELDLPQVLPGEDLGVRGSAGGMPLFYDMDGWPMPRYEDNLQAWKAAMTAFEADRAAGRLRIGRTQVHHRGRMLTVSTVLLGLDHGFGGGVPLIFETMVFLGHTLDDTACFRYATKGAARAGHAAVVTHLRAYYASLRPAARRRPAARTHPAHRGYARRGRW